MKNKWKNENGFLHLIVYLLIFLIFAVTLYICLEVLDLIEVPEKYSIVKWISNHGQTNVTEEFNVPKLDKIENVSKNVKIQIENKVETAFSGETSPDIKSYGANNKKNAKITEVVNNTDTFSYYNQLDDYAKIIYKELEKNLDNMKTGTYNVQFGTTFDDLLHNENGEEILNNSFQLAVNALNFDYPETFFIDIPKLYLLTEIKTKLWTTTYSVQIGCREGQNYLNPTFQNENDVNQAIIDLRREREQIKARILEDSAESKIRIVHDYLVDNLEYDSSVSHENIYNIYGALINRLTVCEGYARAFKYVMDDIGIECLIACGSAVNSTGNVESHAWNYVKLEGEWYAVDVTWDDPVIIGNGFVSNSTKYKYYLKGSNEFFTNHAEEGDIVGDASFGYPELSFSDY